MAVHTDAERTAMRRAIKLAELGPEVGPNPRVGCVLLDSAGGVLGEGWHNGAGTPHAEVVALTDARARGHETRGATAVVTLEPCNHQGRTGPCVRALIGAGVARVVYGVADPGSTSGGGADTLRSAGVDVAEGLDAEAVEDQLRVWLFAMRHGRPFVTAKLASTIDGRIAAADGTSQWITSAQARAHAHRTRAQVDAILVGTGTVFADNPALTAREPDGGLSYRQPLRVVVGCRDLPTGSTLADGPVLRVSDRPASGDALSPSRAGADTAAGAGSVLHLRTHEPSTVLAELARLEVRHVLVEGGPTILSAFLRAGFVDEVHAYIAPVLLGSGQSAVADLGVGTIADARRLQTREVMNLGGDALIVADCVEAKSAHSATSGKKEA